MEEDFAENLAIYDPRNEGFGRGVIREHDTRTNLNVLTLNCRTDTWFVVVFLVCGEYLATQG